MHIQWHTFFAQCFEVVTHCSCEHFMCDICQSFHIQVLTVRCWFRLGVCVELKLPSNSQCCSSDALLWLDPTRVLTSWRHKFHGTIKKNEDDDRKNGFGFGFGFGLFMRIAFAGDRWNYLDAPFLCRRTDPARNKSRWKAPSGRTMPSHSWWCLWISTGHNREMAVMCRCLSSRDLLSGFSEPWVLWIWLPSRMRVVHRLSHHRPSTGGWSFWHLQHPFRGSLSRFQLALFHSSQSSSTVHAG